VKVDVSPVQRVGSPTVAAKSAGTCCGLTFVERRDGAAEVGRDGNFGKDVWLKSGLGGVQFGKGGRCTSYMGSA
jgi:hypothetical protein